jgi:translation initiation factor 2B subunit (eIF-2B alpha/beta/delta family)
MEDKITLEEQAKRELEEEKEKQKKEIIKNKLRMIYEKERDIKKLKEEIKQMIYEKERDIKKLKEEIEEIQSPDYEFKNIYTYESPIAVNTTHNY